MCTVFWKWPPFSNAQGKYLHTYVERGISCTKIVVHQTDEMTKSSLCKNEKPFSNKSFACCVSITYGNRIDGPTVLWNDKLQGQCNCFQSIASYYIFKKILKDCLNAWNPKRKLKYEHKTVQKFKRAIPTHFLNFFRNFLDKQNF